MIAGSRPAFACVARNLTSVHNPRMHDLIDIGVNLTHDSYDSDRDAVIAEALAAGVSRMIVTGTSVTASAKAVELSLAYPDVLYATVGIHPHHASDFDNHSITALGDLLASDRAVAAGECGLDYFRNYSPRSSQLAAFEAQLELAAASRQPVFLHQRDAHEDMLEILARHRPHLIGGVAHCFTGDETELRSYLDLDLYVGITGWICDERRGGSLRQAARSLPLERLMLETDAPYLLPRDLHPTPKSRRNEPRYLPHIAARVADTMQVPLAELAGAATANAERLFGLRGPRS
ncbi:MAG: TatD family hydrolase [Gammaproteobacteria bacterium]|jgi:TatD DNase family protein